MTGSGGIFILAAGRLPQGRYGGSLAGEGAVGLGLTAIRGLESLCLERETLHYKQQVALKYAELVYYGQWFHPLREALDAFVTHAMRHVTGRVKLRLFKGRATIAAITSPQSLYQKDLASFTMGAEYDGKDAIGFIKLLGLPMKVHAMVNKA